MKTIGKEEISKDFGLLIREARQKKGLYQADIAKELGISRVYYSYIETGKRDAYFSTAINICRILDLDICTLEELLK